MHSLLAVRHDARLSITLGLLCAVLALLLGLGAYQLLPALHVEAGQRDEQFLSGVNALEQIGSRASRWTNGNAQLVLPRPAANIPLVLHLTLMNARPAGQADPTVTATANQHEIASFPVPVALRGEGRHYHLLLPADTSSVVVLNLRSDTISLADDPRPLGVVFREVTLLPISGGIHWPPLALIELALASVLAYIALRGMALRAWTAFGLIAAALVGLTLVLIRQPLDVIPYFDRLLAGTGLVATMIWLARLFAPPRKIDGRPFIRATDLPIYLGLAWWAMPLFQIALTLLGVRYVNPAPATLWIGGAVALGLGIALLIRLTGWGAIDERNLLLGVLLAGSLAHGIYLVWFAFTRSGPDFWIHFKAIRGYIRDGAPLYDLKGIAANHFGFSYKWPPFYVVLLRPFIAYGGEHVLLGHRIINTVLLASTALLLLRETRGWQMLAGLLMIFNFRPATDTIAFGQVDVLMLFGLAVTLWAMRRDYDDLAGAVVAVLAMIKLYPALIGLIFIMQGRWRALRGALVAALVYLAISIAVLGWDVHWIWLTQVLGLIGGGTAWVENQTFNGFISRLLGGPIVADPFHHPLAMPLTYIFFALTTGLAMLLAGNRRLPGRGVPLDPDAFLPLQLALFTVVLVLAVPAAWMHYETVTILAFAALVLTNPDELPLGWAAAIAAAYALISYGNQWSFFSSSALGSLGRLALSYKFFGLLLLYAAIVESCWRLRPAPAQQRVLNPSQMVEATRLRF